MNTVFYHTKGMSIDEEGFLCVHIDIEEINEGYRERIITPKIDRYYVGPDGKFVKEDIVVKSK